MFHHLNKMEMRNSTTDPLSLSFWSLVVSSCVCVCVCVFCRPFVHLHDCTMENNERGYSRKTKNTQSESKIIPESQNKIKFHMFCGD